ncbi:hypothetical protein [Allomuricauda sp. SCSIO 65647]|nr:hypothetical protein [Muricauda sp. SCSIO 65647]
MEKSKKVLEKFNPEELEQRFEMGWRLRRGEVKCKGSGSWDGIE